MENKYKATIQIKNLLINTFFIFFSILEINGSTEKTLNENFKKKIFDHYKISTNPISDDNIMSTAHYGIRITHRHPVVIKKFKGKTFNTIFPNEYEILKLFKNENIVRLEDEIYCSDDFKTHFIVLERCDNINLEAFKKKEKEFKMILETTRELLLAIHAMHEANVIHGDIKIENIKFKRGVLKLIGFGKAKFISDDPLHFEEEKIDWNFAAPEVLSRDKYTQAVDIWAYGKILEYLRDDDLIFKNEEEKRIYLNKYDELLKKCLDLNHLKRPTVDECLKSELYDSFVPTIYNINEYMDYEETLHNVCYKKVENTFSFSFPDFTTELIQNEDHLQIIINNQAKKIYALNRREIRVVNIMFRELIKHPKMNKTQLPDEREENVEADVISQTTPGVVEPNSSGHYYFYLSLGVVMMLLSIIFYSF